MLGYVILVHYRPQAFLELLEAVYCEDDAYVVSIDGTSDPSLAEQLLWLEKFDNIRVLINRGVNWSSVSQLDAVLQGIRLLLDCFADVEYLINLSGECFPVKPRSELVAYLAAHQGKSFIGGSPVQNLDEADAAEKSVFAAPDFSPANWPAGYQAVNVLDVCAELFTKGKTRLLGAPSFHLTALPHDARRRLFYLNSDRMADREVYYSFPSDYFISARKHFANKYSGYWHQHTWCVLSREFAEFVFSGEIAFSVYDHVRNCLHPDETFFATVIHNSPLRDRLVGRSLTYANHSRRIEIDEEDVPEIEQGEYFFARKFVGKSAAVKERYRRLVSPEPVVTFCGRERSGEAPARAKMFSHLVANERASWRFGRAFRGEPALGVLRLGSDGTIHGDENLRHWRLDASASQLECYAAAGKPAAVFPSLALARNGKVYLFGRHERDPAAVRYLESEIAKHFRRAADIEETLLWLARLGRLRLDGATAAAVDTAGRDADEPSGFFDDGAATPEAIGYAARLPLGCRIDGRDCGTLPADGAAAGPEWWLAPFGILVTGLFDLEFAVISHGLCGGAGDAVTLFAIARDFTGKPCAVRLHSAGDAEPAAAEA